MTDGQTPRQHYSLDSISADDWFERVMEDAPVLDRLCEVVGRRFVALSVIAGVRIGEVTSDPDVEDATFVQFVVGNAPDPQRLPLPEFRRRVVAHLFADDSAQGPLPEDPDPVDLQEFLGFRQVLMAPLFGVQLRELRVGGDLEPSLWVELEGKGEEVSVADFRLAIERQLAGELAQDREREEVAIDLGAVAQAEEAAAKADWARTIQLLGAWPGPLSVLLRTEDGQRLPPEVKATLSRGLGLLAEAFQHAERFDWAEEVIRLGIQWGREDSTGGALYLRLAESYLRRERHGEALGLLRRAEALGAPEAPVQTALAKSYVACRRFVAAQLCIERARRAGADSTELAPIVVECEQAQGEGWRRFRDFAPLPR